MRRLFQAVSDKNFERIRYLKPGPGSGLGPGPGPGSGSGSWLHVSAIGAHFEPT